MSEGPEVRRTADRLAAALVGERLEVVEARRRVASELGASVVGARVREVRTHGKHIVLVFSNGVFLHNHLMMWGKWRVYPRATWEAGKARPPRRYGERTQPVADVRDDSRVRLVLGNRRHVAVEFNGPILHFSREDPALEGSIARLGPDALAVPFDLREARRRLRARGKLTLADVLLDQTFVAGVGNKYKSELLFLEKLPPFARVSELSRTRAESLLRAIPRLLRVGYETARTRPLGVDESARDWRARHWVFRNNGHPCHVCGARIALDRKSSSRVTYFCPGCQGVDSARAAA